MSPSELKLAKYEKQAQYKEKLIREMKESRKPKKMQSFREPRSAAPMFGRMKTFKINKIKSESPDGVDGRNISSSFSPMAMRKSTVIAGKKQIMIPKRG